MKDVSFPLRPCRRVSVFSKQTWAGNPAYKLWDNSVLFTVLLRNEHNTNI